MKNIIQKTNNVSKFCKVLINFLVTDAISVKMKLLDINFDFENWK